MSVSGNGISSGSSSLKAALSAAPAVGLGAKVGSGMGKPVPPPTIPKTFGSSGPGVSPSPYRLSSRLEGLAQRQRIFDTNLPAVGTNTPTDLSTTTSNGTCVKETTPVPNGTSTPSFDSPLLSKRELFFKNDGSSPGVGVGVGTPNATSNGPSNPPNAAPPPVPPTSAPTPVAASLKESLSKRIAERANSEGGATENGTESKDKYNKLEKDKTVPERKLKELDGYVGFANLPNQVYRKAVKKGFEFTIMLVGESGLGKSTLLNSMFLADIYGPEYPGPSHRIKKTVMVETSRCLLKENGVNLTLTVVDTPGFGDAVDNTNCWQPVIDYVESRYEEFLNSESRVNRKPQPDTRVHCCLYFIAPSGHGLKPLDVEFMQRLHEKANIIPIIAKADTLTPDECTQFKKQILNEIAQHKIKIYEFPETEDDEDAKQHKILRERVPFAIVGSNTVIEVNGKKVRGRKYPWGIAEVENLEHNDFVALRNMLLRTHLQDLKDVTNNVHYENFRCRKLAVLGPDAKQGQGFNMNPLAQLEEEKREHDVRIKKLEVEMEQVFEMKVREKKQKVKDSELDLQKRHEQMRKNLEQQIKELEDKKRALEQEKLDWEQMNGIKLDDLRRRSLERDQGDGKEKKSKKKGLFHS